MRRQAALLGVLVVLGVSGGRWAVLGQESHPYSAGPIAGTVVDPQGEPAAGVKVLLLGGKLFEDPVLLQETATDSAGRFEIAKRRIDHSLVSRPLAITLQESRGRMGGSISGNVYPIPSVELRLKLVDVTDYHGRLVDANGQPIAKAHIKPLRCSSGSTDARVGEASYLLPAGFYLSADQIRTSSAETDADGSFVLRGLPVRGSVSALITAEGFGAPYATFTLEKPVTISLDQPGRIHGSLIGDGKKVRSAGIYLYLRSSSGEAHVPNSDYRVLCFQDTTSERSGDFRFDAVPPGVYTISVEAEYRSPYRSEQTEPIEVKAGQDVAVSIALKRSVTIEGKVVDKTTGKGLKGASVSFRALNASGKPTSGAGSDTTDDQGRFSVRVKQGKVAAVVNFAPKGYINGYRALEPQPVEVTKDMTWPTFELEPAAAIEGIVVDETGKPVAGAEIRAFRSEPYFRQHDVKSDDSGKFTLSLGSSSQPIPLRVRTADAASDGPVNVVPREAKGPVKIVVSRKNAFGLRGTLVDETRKPLGGVKVQLYTMWRIAAGAMGFELMSSATNGQGQFRFTGLWPGDQYYIEVAAEGCDKYETARIAGTAGQIHDFSTIVLPSARGVVEGSVVDSAGKALAGVQVFNAGDAPEAIVTATDAQGRFRLAGLRSGPVYVFAKHHGYRFTGRRVRETHHTAGTARAPDAAASAGAFHAPYADVEIRLLRQGEPLPPTAHRPLPADYPSLEEQQEIGRMIGERLWGTGDPDAIYYLARIDPQRALEWSSKAGGQHDPIVRHQAAIQIADSDLEEAISMASEAGPGAYYTFKSLASRFAKSDPAKAMRCAEEATLCARALDQPRRAICLADAGSLVVRLGNTEAGRKLVEEAAEMVEKMGSGESQRQARGEVAADLAAVDADRALKLLEPITDENERARYLTAVAVAVAPRDLVRAEGILKRVQPNHAQSAVVPIAYRIAFSQPDEALRLVALLTAGRSAYGDDGNAKAKAEALGWVAVAVAAKDQERAWGLIDQALDLCVGPHEGVNSWAFHGGRAAQAALLAVKAREMGYPDMESLVWRVLASRATSDEGPSAIPAMDSQVSMCATLALADPETAREVLEALQPQIDAIGSGATWIVTAEWLKAWALADPRHAVQRAERELAGTKEENLVRTRLALYQVAELLAAPPAERLPLVMRRYASWFPDREW